MCDFFWQRTDSVDHGGDLADIVRSVNAAPSTSSPDVAAAAEAASWQFQQLPGDDFPAPRDPLLHELTGTASFFDGGPDRSASSLGGSCGGDGISSSAASDEMIAQQQKLMRVGDEMKRRPCSSLFSRVLQISPAKVPLSLSPRAIKPMPTVGDMVKLEHGVQISPRAPGMKRRKSQAKKVVCIPAPAAASSRPSGEVVPSDLWAWRKYGQKPIKGSPYPRGYYRCSSSKGCSARKQVERSRTDPNMLVITYTSEHNHPWPTQRNALAGSTRAQPHKNSSTSSTSKSSTSNLKEEPKNINPNTNSSSSLPTVKEEVVSGMDNVTVNNVFYNEPASMAGSSQPDDFFADLAELEPDPMSLIFSGSGFVGQKPEIHQEKESSKGLDPFIDNMFNW